MYNYEWSPQTNLISPGSLLKFGQIYMRDGDGTIIVSSSVYEGVTIAATKDWLAQIGKPSFALSPLSLPKHKRRLDENKDVLQFLDAMATKFGARSLIYVGEVCFSYEMCPSEMQVDIVRNLFLSIPARKAYDSH